MNNSHPSPIVRIKRYRNRTRTGKRTAKAARKAAIYFAYGRELSNQATAGQARQRGQWLGPDGKTYSHEAALAWAQDAAKTYEYTFQALLSVPQGRLTAEDYGQALEQAGILPDWRLVVHDDTAFSHAHVLFFRDKLIEKEKYLRWQAKISQMLAISEQQRLSEPEVEKGLSHNLERSMPEVELE